MEVKQKPFNEIHIPSSKNKSTPLVLILFIFFKFQQAHRENTCFNEQVRNTSLAPVNTNWLLLSFKFLTELQQESQNQTVQSYFSRVFIFVAV